MKDSFTSQAEEIPAALLLAHAAQLSLMKGARRRAALWFLFAANRLEKCGIVSALETSASRLPFTRFVSQETLNHLFLEESTDDLRITGRERILTLFLGNRGSIPKELERVRRYCPWG